jgi:ligand-binding sensor domain-containing protein
MWSIDADGAGISIFTDAGVLSTDMRSLGLSGAKALAIDGNNITWIASGNGTVSAFTNAGTAVLTTPIDPVGSTAATKTISVDGAGSLWIANPGSNSVIEVIGAAGSVTTPIVTQVINSSTGTRP